MPKKSSKRQVASSKGEAAKGKRKKLVERHGDSGARLLPLPARVWYRPRTWVRHVPPPAREPLPKARHILVEAGGLLGRHWKVFGGIALIYGVLNVLLVSGLSDPSGVDDFKTLLDGVVHGTGGHILSALASFAVLVGGTTGSASQVGGVYQSLLLLGVSLAVIWALRQAVAGHVMRVRDSFYRGMYPMVPFLLVFLALSVQLLPAAIGGYLYSAVIGGGIAVDGGEKFFFGLGFTLCVLWSLRMVGSSLFALYIVTLPDMTPLRALRSARELVYKRRLLIWRKLVLLPVALLVVAALIEIPLILFLTPLAYWVYFVLSTLMLVYIHAYLYTLYRKLL